MQLHIYFSAVAGEKLFRDDLDCARFVTRFSNVLRRSDVRVLAGALVVNHCHFVMVCGSRVSVANIWHEVLSGYVPEYNKRWKRRGRLLGSEYQSVVIRSDQQLLITIRYVHLNRVRAGLVRAEHIEKDPWCGASELAGNREPRLLTLESALRIYGNTDAAARREARRSLLEAPGDLEKFEEMDRRIARLPVFESPKSAAVDRRSIFEMASRRACEELGVERKALLTRSRERTVCAARALTVHHCLAEGMRPRRCAALLGIAASGIQRLATRGRLVAERDVEGLRRSSVG